MRWALLVLSIVIGLHAREHTSFACINATLSETEAVRKLKDAEAALDQGDVLTARELAGEVHHLLRMIAPENPLFVRAARIEALAYVRDRNASEPELSGAVRILREVVEPKVDRPWPPSPTPVVLADFGEALERAGQDDEAFNVLEPLALRDLIGSAYAYAAFSRAAKAKGDTSFATLAMTRCETIAVNPSMCRGEYPNRPFLRARPIDLAIVGVIFLAIGLVRRVRPAQPWSSFRAPMFAATIAGFGTAAFVLANARVGWAANAVVVPLLFFSLHQRSLWLSAVRRGTIPGFAIRPEAEGEGTTRDAPAKTLWLFDGARAPEVLERTLDPSYRESARAPALFRLEHSRVPLAALLTAGLLIVLVAVCVLVLVA